MTGSFIYTLNGIFNNPSRYCRDFDPESSDFALISFNFIIALSFTESDAFNKHICCSNGILFMSKLDKSLVYCIVFFIASRKYCFIDHGKLSNNMTCSCVSIEPLESFDKTSYNKYAIYLLFCVVTFINNCISIFRLIYKSDDIKSFTVWANVFCFIDLY